MSPPQAYIPSENSISNQTTSVPPPPPPPPPEGLLSNSRVNMLSKVYDDYRLFAYINFLLFNLD